MAPRSRASGEIRGGKSIAIHDDRHRGALAGRQGIGGSRVIQHWELSDEKSTAKSALRGGQVDAFDPAALPPLLNLYVTMLQRLGIETDRFGSSTGTLTGMEVIG